MVERGSARPGRREGWPTVNVDAASVVAIEPAMRHDGKRATNSKGEGLWVVFARVPDGTHLGARDISGMVVSSIARNSQLVAYKDGSARLGDGVSEVTLSFRPNAPLPLFSVTGSGDARQIEGAASERCGAETLWALARSIKQRRSGQAMPATEGQVQALSRLLGDRPLPEGLSKLEASALIESLASSRPATDRQVDLLGRLGYEGDASQLGLAEASREIGRLIAESREESAEEPGSADAHEGKGGDAATDPAGEIDSAMMWRLIAEGRLDEARAIVSEAIGGAVEESNEVIEEVLEPEGERNATVGDVGR